MAGKQAKILSENSYKDLLTFAATTRYPVRNRLIVLLSLKAGLRAGEIAKLTWEMVLDPNGAIATAIARRAFYPGGTLYRHAGKRGMRRRPAS